MAEKKKNSLKITQVKSTIKATSRQKATIQALGLGRPNQSVERTDDPRVLGQISKVNHLIKVEKLG
jgi:large subunit ribosomal protein L30